MPFTYSSNVVVGYISEMVGLGRYSKVMSGEESACISPTTRVTTRGRDASWMSTGGVTAITWSEDLECDIILPPHLNVCDSFSQTKLLKSDLFRCFNPPDYTRTLTSTRQDFSLSFDLSKIFSQSYPYFVDWSHTFSRQIAISRQIADWSQPLNLLHPHTLSLCTEVRLLANSCPQLVDWSQTLIQSRILSLLI